MRALKKDIRAMPKSSRPKIRYINPDDDVDDLIQNIEDLQSSNNNLKQQIRNLKIDNINKDKEINYLKDELDNMQKELDDKKVENEKEIEEIFKNNDEESIPKLKNAYSMLLLKMNHKKQAKAILYSIKSEKMSFQTKYNIFFTLEHSY